jgi:hypothetical protein
MKKINLKTIILIYSLFFGFVFPIQGKNTVKDAPFYGSEIKATQAVKLDSVIRDFASYKGKSIVMEASVDKVCEMKGCWMTLKGTDKTFRVKFKDYDFFVPMSLVGKNVWLEGEVVRSEVSIKDTKHYLKDAGASKEEIAAVTKPSVEYRIIAQGVRPLL